MRTLVAADPGTPGAENEDVAMTGSNMVVVADGLTARTETGCIHGVAWFTTELSAAILRYADREPRDALAAAIRDTASSHKDSCDLSHPATPCAAVGIVQIVDDLVQYAVLGDVTIVIDAEHLLVFTDPRIRGTASAERRTADAIPAGAPGKSEALIAMKKAELSERNTVDGYWIAGANPTAADHAIVGSVPRSTVQRLAILTDGAARMVELFKVFEWSAVLDLVSELGPHELLSRLRALERSDPDTTKWPRNKVSDDAAMIYCDQVDMC